MRTDEQALGEQEARLRFAHFNHNDARLLGMRASDVAAERGLAVVVSIRLGSQLVFQVGLAGTSTDNDHWLERKVATVYRFNASSLLVRSRFQRYGVDPTDAAMAIEPATYALSGGAVPIRIGDTIVGVLAVSGLTDEEDHALAVELLSEHLATAS